MIAALQRTELSQAQAADIEHQLTVLPAVIEAPRAAVSSARDIVARLLAASDPVEPTAASSAATQAAVAVSPKPAPGDRASRRIASARMAPLSIRARDLASVVDSFAKDICAGGAAAAALVSASLSSGSDGGGSSAGAAGMRPASRRSFRTTEAARAAVLSSLQPDIIRRVLAATLNTASAMASHRRMISDADIDEFVESDSDDDDDTASRFGADSRAASTIGSLRGGRKSSSMSALAVAVEQGEAGAGWETAVPMGAEPATPTLEAEPAEPVVAEAAEATAVPAEFVPATPTLHGFEFGAGRASKAGLFGSPGGWSLDGGIESGSRASRLQSRGSSHRMLRLKSMRPLGSTVGRASFHIQAALRTAQTGSAAAGKDSRSLLDPGSRVSAGAGGGGATGRASASAMRHASFLANGGEHAGAAAAGASAGNFRVLLPPRAVLQNMVCAALSATIRMAEEELELEPQQAAAPQQQALTIGDGHGAHSGESVSVSSTEASSYGAAANAAAAIAVDAAAAAAAKVGSHHEGSRPRSRRAASGGSTGAAARLPASSVLLKRLQTAAAAAAAGAGRDSLRLIESRLPAPSFMKARMAPRRGRLRGPGQGREDLAFYAGAGAAARASRSAMPSLPGSAGGNLSGHSSLAPSSHNSVVLTKRPELGAVLARHGIASTAPSPAGGAAAASRNGADASGLAGGRAVDELAAAASLSFCGYFLWAARRMLASACRCGRGNPLQALGAAAYALGTGRSRSRTGKAAAATEVDGGPSFAMNNALLIKGPAGTDLTSPSSAAGSAAPVSVRTSVPNQQLPTAVARNSVISVQTSVPGQRRPNSAGVANPLATPPRPLPRPPSLLPGSRVSSGTDPGSGSQITANVGPASASGRRPSSVGASSATSPREELPSASAASLMRAAGTYAGAGGAPLSSLLTPGNRRSSRVSSAAAGTGAAGGMITSTSPAHVQLPAHSTQAGAAGGFNLFHGGHTAVDVIAAAFADDDAGDAGGLPSIATPGRRPPSAGQTDAARRPPSASSAGSQAVAASRRPSSSAGRRGIASSGSGARRSVSSGRRSGEGISLVAMGSSGSSGGTSVARLPIPMPPPPAPHGSATAAVGQSPGERSPVTSSPTRAAAQLLPPAPLLPPLRAAPVGQSRRGLLDPPELPAAALLRAASSRRVLPLL